ncbi:MAG: hypothetical protein ABSE67_02265 [Xanthobacteraceae bacterium]|jgi:hypothetical protein
MIAVLTAIKYLSQITDQLFETQMQRAAIRISARSRLFNHQAI